MLSESSNCAINQWFLQWNHLLKMEKQKFEVIIEQDEDGIYLASVPSLPGCHTQAQDISKIEERIMEAIMAYLGSSPEAELK